MKKKFIFFFFLGLIPITSLSMIKKTEKEKTQKKELSFEQFTLKAQDAYNLGLYHYYNLKEYDQAFKYIKMAAENNHREAQYYLAFMYFEGKGCKKDLSEAMKYCNLARKRGNQKAQELWFAIVTEFVKESAKGGGQNPLQLVLDPSMLGQDEGDEEEEISGKTKKGKDKKQDEAWRSMYI